MGDEIGCVVSRMSTMRIGCSGCSGPPSIVLHYCRQGGHGMLHRRTLLAAAALAPLAARAQEGSIVLGSLTPLTGAGGSYGPAMRDVIAAVIKQVNDAGGVLGRQVRLVSEDDQTNPDAG